MICVMVFDIRNFQVKNYLFNLRSVIYSTKFWIMYDVERSTNVIELQLGYVWVYNISNWVSHLMSAIEFPRPLVSSQTMHLTVANIAITPTENHGYVIARNVMRESILRGLNCGITQASDKWVDFLDEWVELLSNGSLNVKPSLLRE